jgi:hypothetical protein
VSPASAAETGGRAHASAPRGFEAWTRLALALAALVVLLHVVHGSRPGGLFAIRLYQLGPIALGLASALLLVLGIAWCLLRPPPLQRGRLSGLLALAAALWLCSYPLPYPSSHADHPSAVPFRLPFRGEWTTRWGGDRRSANALVLTPGSRYGFEFVPGEGAPRAVLAPAAGQVVAVDAPPGDEGEERGAGRRVVLAVAEGEYLVLAGLGAGALRVAPGQRVAAGEPLGELADGATAALRVFLQDAPERGRGEGIPMEFHGYVADGFAIEAGTPLGPVPGRPAGSRVWMPAGAEGDPEAPSPGVSR